MKNKIFKSYNTAVLTSFIFLMMFSQGVFAQQKIKENMENSTQLVLNIKFKTTPEQAPKFKAILIELFNTIAHENNFVNADLHEAIGKPGEFLVYEVWNDNIAHFIDVQMKKAYAVAFEKTLEEMKVVREPAAYHAFGHWNKK